MHRDHEDYKPWVCHLCGVRTAFVKTLYRHLKQEHGTSGCPCHVCGKTFTRAQSMLLHVNTKHQDIQTGSSVDFDGFSKCKKSEELQDIDDKKITMKTVEDINRSVNLPEEKPSITVTESDNHYRVNGSVIRYCTRLTSNTNAIRSKQE